MDEIGRIKDLEEKLDKDINKAFAASQKAIEDYKSNMPEIIEREKSNARARAREHINTEKLEGEQTAKFIIADSANYVKHLHLLGEKNFESAVQMIVSEF